LPLAASMASASDSGGGPPGQRCDPIDGRPMRARSAISPRRTSISRTAASCSGPRRSTVSGRPIPWFWLPPL
jgi:hypothetical protein